MGERERGRKRMKLRTLVVGGGNSWVCDEPSIHSWVERGATVFPRNGISKMGGCRCGGVRSSHFMKRLHTPSPRMCTHLVSPSQSSSMVFPLCAIRMSIFVEAPRAVWWWGTTQLLPRHPSNLLLLLLFFWCRRRFVVVFFLSQRAAPFLSLPPPPSHTHTHARARPRARCLHDCL